MAASCPSLRVRCRSVTLSRIRHGSPLPGVDSCDQLDDHVTWHCRSRDRSTLAQVRVWLSDWEWQCCGEPFSVGNEVAWGLVPLPTDDQYLVGVLGAEVAAGLTHRETHHADEDERPVPTRVRIESISAVYWHEAPGP